MGLAVVGAATLSTLATGVSGDYVARGAVSADNAGPALAALAHGNLDAYASHQPLMGLTSLLLRFPVVALGSAAGAGELTLYRLGALACVLPCALFVAWLIGRAELSLATLASGALLTWAVLLAGPAREAISSGHPEELLASTFAAGAVLAAWHERPSLAGLLLAVGIGTKPWVALASFPVMIALRHGRLRAGSIAAAGAAVLVLPPVVLDPGAYAAAGRAFGSGHLANALSGWWPLGTGPAPGRLVDELPLGLDKSSALLLGLGCGLGLTLIVWLVARRRGRRADAFALLALLALARCVSDPGPVEYYFLAAIVPVALWEFSVRRRPPLVAVVLAATASAAFSTGARLGAGELNALVLASAGTLAAYLVVCALRSRPQQLRR